MRFSKSVLIAAVTIVAPFISSAAPVAPGTVLSVGGYTFDDFSCSTVKTHNSIGNCGTLAVSSLTAPVTGIQFTTAQTALGILSADDATVNYHVHSAGQITGVGLDFNGTWMGLAVASVTETIKDDAGKIVGFADVSCGTLGCSRQDNITLEGSYDDLYIIKDIKVAALAGSADISYVDQTFNATATPEPSSIALLGSGLLAAGAGLLRRRKAAVKA